MQWLDTSVFRITDHAYQQYRARIDPNGTHDDIERSIRVSIVAGRRRKKTIRKAAEAIGKGANIDDPLDLFTVDEQANVVYVIRIEGPGRYKVKTCWRIALVPLQTALIEQHRSLDGLCGGLRADVVPDPNGAHEPAPTGDAPPTIPESP